MKFHASRSPSNLQPYLRLLQEFWKCWKKWWKKIFDLTEKSFYALSGQVMSMKNVRNLTENLNLTKFLKNNVSGDRWSTFLGKALVLVKKALLFDAVFFIFTLLNTFQGVKLIQCRRWDKVGVLSVSTYEVGCISDTLFADQCLKAQISEDDTDIHTQKAAGEKCHSADKMWSPWIALPYQKLSGKCVWYHWIHIDPSKLRMRPAVLPASTLLAEAAPPHGGNTSQIQHFSVSKPIFHSMPNFAIIHLAPTTSDPSKASLTLVYLLGMLSCPNKFMTTHKFVPKWEKVEKFPLRSKIVYFLPCKNFLPSFLLTKYYRQHIRPFDSFPDRVRPHGFVFVPEKTKKPCFFSGKRRFRGEIRRNASKMLYIATQNLDHLIWSILVCGAADLRNISKWQPWYGQRIHGGR